MQARPPPLHARLRRVAARLCGACLREVANRLQRHAATPGGQVARNGGEEFVVVLAATGADIAQALAEALRNAVAAAPVKTAPAPLWVTIGVGASTARPQARDSPGAALKRADEALYRAKRKERNRVVAHPATPAEAIRPPALARTAARSTLRDMDLIAQIALAGGLAWASGIRLYATVLLLGLLGRFDYVDLPAALSLVESDWVLWTAGVLTVGEFVADKVPAFDSLWDALQTFVRVPAGMLLAWGALDDHGAGPQLAAALIGGAITSGTHLTKAGSRAAINHSPEPVSNWIASFTEDGVVVGGLLLALANPWLFLGLLLAFLLLCAWLLPKLWRALRGVFRRLRGRPPADASA